MKRYLIGIQPTGKLHIGNYLGCIKKGLKYQQEGHEVIFLIANYHSLTTDNYSDVTEQELIKLGCKNIKRQTPEYTELFFKLCCKLNVGKLARMPQYKDKKDDVDFDLGLMLYPVLMAADIIINDPDVVIIGKDQIPHLDLCNDICKDKKYEYEMGDVDKIMSLTNSSKKMSKSLGEKHVLYLFNEDYQSKLRKASVDENGLQNLLKIANGIGADVTDITLNSVLKDTIAEQMKKIFN